MAGSDTRPQDRWSGRLAYEDVRSRRPGPGRCDPPACERRELRRHLLPFRPLCRAGRASIRSRRRGRGRGDWLARASCVRGGRPCRLFRQRRKLCQERTYPAERLVKLPDAISYEQAAGMMLKGMTAQYLIRADISRRARAYCPRPCGCGRRRADCSANGRSRWAPGDRHRRLGGEGDLASGRRRSHHPLQFRRLGSARRQDHRRREMRCRL